MAIYADENIWLTRKRMAVLYDVTVPAVNRHLKILSKDEEIRRLKAELKQAKMERGILKKAAAFFANHSE